MRECDVLVVGGGPAGSSAAWGLRGLDVVVFDRQPFPRDKVCAGWVTPPVLGALEVDVQDYAVERVLQPLRGFSVSLQGSPSAAGDCGELASFAVRRCEFDHYLLARTGAELRLGAPLADLRREGGRWVANGEIAARWLVGAGGHFCPVARALGARPGESEPTTVVAREIEFEMTPEQQARCPVPGELPEIFFARDLRGYAWVVRKGDWLNVGLGRQDQDSFPQHCDALLDWLEAEGRVPPGLPRRLRGHAYLLHAQSPRRLADVGVLFAGDAAGLAYARSGEGIRPAVESGLLAARALRGALERGAAPGGEVESAYADVLLARFGPRGGAPRRGATDWLPRRWRAGVAARCLAWPWFAREVVVSHWFLHREIPPLAC